MSRSPANESALPSDPPAAPAYDKSDLDQTRMDHLMGYATARAAAQMKKCFMRHIGPLDLKTVEFSVLVLVASNQTVNQKQLGQALDVSAPNLAVILDRLQERGLIQRVRSEQDRREQHIKLTDAGRELGARAEKIAATMETNWLRMLSEAERLLLLELLRKVAAGKG
jgi:DNA-binding MarR family transcriptional regulator